MRKMHKFKIININLIFKIMELQLNSLIKK